MKIDGLAASYTPSTFAAAINNRLAVPSIIAIDVECVGDSTGGTAYIDITAEQEPAAGTIKVWATILQDHIMGTSAWGGYNNKELMWIPIVYPLGINGTVLEFTGPYPQTISVEGTYLLHPETQIYENLNISAFVQYTTGTKEVLNSFFEGLPGISTGITEEDSDLLLGAWPNPSTGTFSVSTQLPQGVNGTVEIFDVSGRSIETFEAGSIQSMTINEAGLYFIRLTTTSGEVINRQVAIVR